MRYFFTFKGIRFETSHGRVFGYTSFQPNQEQALDLILSRKNVFVSLPTSGGKSLLYMLPSIVSSSLTVVVVPLKSLIEDQFARCQGLGLPAAILHGDVSYCDREKVFAELKQPNSEIRLLYITAEFLSNTPSLMELLAQLNAANSLRQFVVDEAHCVSQWGHDFRPAYNFLKSLHTKFHKSPILTIECISYSMFIATPGQRQKLWQQYCKQQTLTVKHIMEDYQL